MLQKPPSQSIPDAPGSYQFLDGDGRVIYVGKAKSLRQRIQNYFQPLDALMPRTQLMMAQAESLEWIQVDTDVEALVLEFSLIKRYKPRYNVKLRDDKSYPVLAVTVNQAWPKAFVTRAARQKGVKYFGPYPPRLGFEGDLGHVTEGLSDPHMFRPKVRKAEEAW